MLVKIMPSTRFHVKSKENLHGLNCSNNLKPSARFSLTEHFLLVSESTVSGRRPETAFFLSQTLESFAKCLQKRLLLP